MNDVGMVPLRPCRRASTRYVFKRLSVGISRVAIAVSRYFFVALALPASAGLETL
jgi:hypothetical protein